MSNPNDLPQGWTSRRLRFDATLNPRKSAIALDAGDEVTFVPMEAVGELGGLDTSLTREVAEVYNGYTYFADGDVCVAKITPCFENGKGALAEGLVNGVGFGTTELHVIRPRAGLDPRYLFYITIAHDFRQFGASEMLGAGGQKRVPEDFIKDWQPPLPPLETQRRIACVLDEKTARIDELIQKLGGSTPVNKTSKNGKSLTGLLFEYRAALITAAVTGQLPALNG